MPSSPSYTCIAAITTTTIPTISTTISTTTISTTTTTTWATVCCIPFIYATCTWVSFNWFGFEGIGLVLRVTDIGDAWRA